ncbi:MAG TPA: argininosuccinate synthase [Candidatus Glassbacteria bacterium]|nr:argininosuccinate synthase [Candidatus Glassbacteria bacterium]
MKKNVKKVVLAYSGGLDTSVIIPWLRENYPGCEVIAFSADIGQREDLSGLEQKAINSGASKCYIRDLREEFVSGYIWPTLKAGAIYERRYLLGTSMARPLIAKHMVAVAEAEGADAVSHGATGKGNDQVRFELTTKALNPALKIIAPWREWHIRSREDAIDYAAAHNVPVEATKTRIYSRDENLWHLSHEGGELEDPWNEPREEMFRLTVSPEKAPDRPTLLELEFDKGVPVALDGKKLGPVALVEKLNEIGGRNGVGRVDMVENRLVGMKSRGVYETPGGSIIVFALRELESICLDRESLLWKDQLALKYAHLVYNGQWFTNLREQMDAHVNEAMKFVSGHVRLKLYKGNLICAGRKSPHSLYRQEYATFGEEAVYDQHDAEGFINIFGLPLTVDAILEREGARPSLRRNFTK